MYSQKVITASLDSEAKRLGFNPVYHSVAEARQAVDAFNTLRDSDGNVKRPMRPDEIKWVRNERALCRADFEYFRSRYWHIQTPDNRVVLMQPNVAQRIISSVYAEFEDADVSIELLYNKARQLGITTDTDCRIGQRFMTRSNVKALLASSDPDKSEEMAKKIDLALKQMPYWLIPEMTAYSMSGKGGYMEFGAQNSLLLIQHGSQVRGLARGTTPTMAHLSEVSEFENPEESIDASLLRAMHGFAEVFIVLESTSKGIGNWWHKQWEMAVSKWPRGRSRLRPVFLPWFVGRELYPTEAWLRKFPIPSDWIPSDIVVKHAERARANVQANDLLRLHLGSNWLMPREQMWYYEFEREQAAAKKELNKFLEEMPADDVEAFQVTGLSVFDVDLLQRHHENCTPPLGVYGFEARFDVVPERLQAPRSEIDPGKPKLEVRSKWGDAPSTDVCLVPLKWDGYHAGDDGHGKLYIWRWPENGWEYGIGADSSEGIGHDQSVMEVMSRENLFSKSVQCAEYSSQFVNPIDLWPLLLTVGTLYSTMQNHHAIQPMMAIEVRTEADNTLLELRKRGWRNFCPWVGDIARKKMDIGKSQRLGWYTNTWSRRRIMAWLIKNVRDDNIVIHSPWLINELKTLHRDEDEQALRAEGGAFDDRVMAFAIDWYALHWMELSRGELQGLEDLRQARVESEHGRYPVWKPGPEATVDPEVWDAVHGPTRNLNGTLEM